MPKTNAASAKGDSQSDPLVEHMPSFKDSDTLSHKFTAVKTWGKKLQRQCVQDARLKEEYRAEKEWLWTAISALWGVIVFIVGATIAEETVFNLLRPYFSAPGQTTDGFHKTMFQKLTNVSNERFGEMFHDYNRRHPLYKTGYARMEHLPDLPPPSKKRKLDGVTPSGALYEACSEHIPAVIDQPTKYLMHRDGRSLLETTGGVMEVHGLTGDSFNNAFIGANIAILLKTRENMENGKTWGTDDWDIIEGTKK